ncbi:hypothetical protein JOD78_000483 [Herbaspirillum sp. 1130]|nr:hypothetical protein [Herbaspirillum sp. 1130]
MEPHRRKIHTGRLAGNPPARCTKKMISPTELSASAFPPIDDRSAVSVVRYFFLPFMEVVMAAVGGASLAGSGHAIADQSMESAAETAVNAVTAYTKFVKKGEDNAIQNI